MVKKKDTDDKAATAKMDKVLLKMLKTPHKPHKKPVKSGKAQ